MNHVPASLSRVISDSGETAFADFVAIAEKVARRTAAKTDFQCLVQLTEKIEPDSIESIEQKAMVAVLSTATSNPDAAEFAGQLRKMANRFDVDIVQPEVVVLGLVSDIESLDPSIQDLRQRLSYAVRLCLGCHPKIDRKMNVNKLLSPNAETCDTDSIAAVEHAIITNNKGALALVGRSQNWSLVSKSSSLAQEVSERIPKTATPWWRTAPALAAIGCLAFLFIAFLIAWAASSKPAAREVSETKLIQIEQLFGKRVLVFLPEGEASIPTRRLLNQLQPSQLNQPNSEEAKDVTPQNPIEFMEYAATTVALKLPPSAFCKSPKLLDSFNREDFGNCEYALLFSPSKAGNVDCFAMKLGKLPVAKTEKSPGQPAVLATEVASFSLPVDFSSQLDSDRDILRRQLKLVQDKSIQRHQAIALSLIGDAEDKLISACSLIRHKDEATALKILREAHAKKQLTPLSKRFLIALDISNRKSLINRSEHDSDLDQFLGDSKEAQPLHVAKWVEEVLAKIN